MSIVGSVPISHPIAPYAFRFSVLILVTEGAVCHHLCHIDVIMCLTWIKPSPRMPPLSQFYDAKSTAVGCVGKLPMEKELELLHRLGYDVL